MVVTESHGKRGHVAPRARPDVVALNVYVSQIKQRLLVHARNAAPSLIVAGGEAETGGKNRKKATTKGGKLTEIYRKYGEYVYFESYVW